MSQSTQGSRDKPEPNQGKSARIGNYSIRIMGPNWAQYAVEGGNNSDAFREFDKTNQEVIDGISNALCGAEDVINDALPDGFYCKIEG